MAENTIRTELATIQSSQADFQNRLKLSSFFTLMQDMASNHADALGVGYDALLRQDMAWVLSRKKIQFFDFPRMGETVTLKTWPKGLQQKLFFMRDHEMTGADGRRLAAATSAYVLINARTRRIVMPAALDLNIPDNGGLSAINETLEKIPAAPEGLRECQTIHAAYSAVDVIGHVNNSRYVEWISDCFSMEEHRANRPAWLQINFLNEVLPGERVILHRGARGENPGAWYLSGTNAASGTKAFEAELHWQ
jgi:acyl-ACP thioesterase